MQAGTIPVEVTTGRAYVCPRVLDELIPTALHTVGQYANNPVEADHGRLKARLRPMRGLRSHRSARNPGRRSCLRAECAPRPLRHRHRRLRPPQAPEGLRRPRTDNLTSKHPSHAPTPRRDRITQQCRPRSLARPQWRWTGWRFTSEAPVRQVRRSQVALVLQPEIVTFIVRGLAAGSGRLWRGAGGVAASRTSGAGARCLAWAG
jgi:hypothetical protein